MKKPTKTKYLDIRFHTGGWRVGFGPFYARWNKLRMDNGRLIYSELTIGRVTSKDFSAVGGMSFKDWRIAKKQKEDALRKQGKT